jgi:hypothetical protein
VAVLVDAVLVDAVAVEPPMPTSRANPIAIAQSRL